MKGIITLCILGLALYLCEGSFSCSSDSCTNCLKDKKCVFVVGMEDSFYSLKSEKLKGIRYKALVFSQCKIVERMQEDKGSKQEETKAEEFTPEIVKEELKKGMHGNDEKINGSAKVGDFG